MERDAWLEKYSQGAKLNYEAALEFGKRWADRIEAANSILEKKIPHMAKTLKDENFEVQHVKTTGRPGNISEFAAVVIIGKGAQREIYGVHYSDEAYASIGVKKGFTVRVCLKPSEYTNVISFAGKPSLWQEMGEKTHKFMEAVGLVLDNRLPMLTEEPHSVDFNQVMAVLEGQVGKLP